MDKGMMVLLYMVYDIIVKMDKLIRDILLIWMNFIVCCLSGKRINVFFYDVLKYLK